MKKQRIRHSRLPAAGGRGGNPEHSFKVKFSNWIPVRQRTDPPWRTSAGKTARQALAGMATLLLNASRAMAMARPPADPNAPPPPPWVSFMPIVVMIFIFYILLIRPQMRQKKDQENMIRSLKKGDRILTSGGFFATVVNLGPDFVEVKLNEETRVKIQRSAVAQVLLDKPDGKE